MKKFVSMIMALAMVCALSVTAFAANEVATLGPNDKEVKATYTAAGEAPKPADVISVTLSWTITDAVYTADGYVYTWDATSRQYTRAAAGNEDTGEKTKAKVSVTVNNSSNVALTVSAVYTDAGTGVGSSAATADWGAEKTVASAAEGIDYKTDYVGSETAKTGEIKSEAFSTDINVTDYTKLTSGVATKIGTVTVTIAKAAG